MIKAIKFVLLFSIFTGCSMLVKVSATSLVVESFNIRYDNPDDAINAWPNRQHLIYAHLKTLQPDVLECLLLYFRTWPMGKRVICRSWRRKQNFQLCIKKANRD